MDESLLGEALRLTPGERLERYEARYAERASGERGAGAVARVA